MNKQVQFSVFLVNKPGVLTQIFRELGKAKVNVEALAMMDTTEHGVLRLTVDDSTGARKVFGRLNIPVSEAEVLCVELPNRPGAGADLCERLASAHMNIGYLYCTGGTAGGPAGMKTNVVLKVPDIKKAMKVLEERPQRREMKLKRRDVSMNGKSRR